MLEEDDVDADDSHITDEEKKVLKSAASKMVDQIEKKKGTKYSKDVKNGKEKKFYNNMVKMVNGEIKNGKK